MACIFSCVWNTKETAAGRFLFATLELVLSRAKEEKGFKRIPGGCGGGDNAVIFKSDSEQLKSHFIHQVTNETSCSEWNGERQLKQPDCLMYLLMPAPYPSAANSKTHMFACYVVILILEWH